MKPAVKVKWNKKEQDWNSHYPEWTNRNARILGNNFFAMIRQFEEWKGCSLRETISSAGFDPDTFVISVKAKEGEDT